MINIERSILVSILESDFICNDKEIANTVLNPDYFTHPHHKIFAKSINRLRELDEPICSDTLRDKFIESGKWESNMIDGVRMENTLIEVMAHTPFYTKDIFYKYYKHLESNYNEQARLRALIYI